MVDPSFKRKRAAVLLFLANLYEWEFLSALRRENIVHAPASGPIAGHQSEHIRP